MLPTTQKRLINKQTFSQSQSSHAIFLSLVMLSKLCKKSELTDAERTDLNKWTLGTGEKLARLQRQF